jgi:MbtH protein
MSCGGREMRNEPEDDGVAYAVVVNRQEQYSIWRADREPPPGWRSIGKVGNKGECLAHVATAWTDMRPLSVRLQSPGGR